MRIFIVLFFSVWIQASASSVNNSLLPSFPPIGDQGDLESCVAWASTYYQATHELGLVHGWNNKQTNRHILSPYWTNFFINKGAHNGSSLVLAYRILSAHGVPSLIDFPFEDPNLIEKMNFLFYRLNNSSLIPGLGGKEIQDLTAIKESLNQGHVLTFASFIDSWVYTKVKKDPFHEGEYAVSWMNGTLGGHFMTIVGYDDNLWIDINENGIVDEGERGAFLIANSWGSEWKVAVYFFNIIPKRL